MQVNIQGVEHDQVDLRKRKILWDNDRRETLVLYRRCEQYCIILSSRNKSFP